MNLIGAALIMLGCTVAGIIKARSLSETDKTYGALISALSLMKSEISSPEVTFTMMAIPTHLIMGRNSTELRPV